MADVLFEPFCASYRNRLFFVCLRVANSAALDAIGVSKARLVTVNSEGSSSRFVAGNPCRFWFLQCL